MAADTEPVIDWNASFNAETEWIYYRFLRDKLGFTPEFIVNSIPEYAQFQEREQTERSK